MIAEWKFKLKLPYMNYETEMLKLHKKMLRSQIQHAMKIIDILSMKLEPGNLKNEVNDILIQFQVALDLTAKTPKQ